MGNTLADYKLHFEDVPRKTTYNINTAKRGGKDITKMSKEVKTTEAKSNKKYAKTRGEHFKDIVIAVLVTAIIGFVIGMQFQSRQQDAIEQAMKSVTPSASAEAPVKK